MGPAFTATDASPANVAPDTFRALNDTGYLMWVSATMIGAVRGLGSAAIALRRAVFPRWFAWLSVLVGIVQLFAVLFFPILLGWAWILVAGLLVDLEALERPGYCEGARAEPAGTSAAVIAAQESRIGKKKTANSCAIPTSTLSHANQRGNAARRSEMAALTQTAIGSDHGGAHPHGSRCS